MFFQFARENSISDGVCLLLTWRGSAVNRWHTVGTSRQDQQNFSLDNDAIIWHHSAMTRKHRKTLERIFAHPPSAKVKWRDIEALFRELGAEVTEREGSRVGVRLFGERRVFHRPHPSPDADKGAVASIRRWFEKNGVKP